MAFEIPSAFRAIIWLTSLGLYAFLLHTRVKRKNGNQIHREYFPGPPSDLMGVLGHIRIMPTDYQWLKFAEWGKKLGDVIYVHLMGRPVIILNSAEAARDLMDKRGANFSDRPPSILQGELLGWKITLPFLRYGDRFRKQRRMMQQFFNSQSVASFRDLQTEQLAAFLKQLLARPDDFRHHVHRMNTAVLMMATYGHRVESDDDTYTNLAFDAVSKSVAIAVPGAALVDFFPFLRHLPSWFPGAGFNKDVGSIRNAVEKMYSLPYEEVKESVASGTAVPSLLSHLLENHKGHPGPTIEDEDDMRGVGGIIYAAGVETSEVVIATFFLMMVHNPAVSKRAQAEIDNVIGPNQLPTHDDRARLPFVECIFKEVLRYNPPVPLSLPHQSIDEEVYRDKIIPAGSMIIPNIWNMMRDERYFKDPDKFNPERFWDKVGGSKGSESSASQVLRALTVVSADDPSSLVFGFGRRICPGRFFADAGAWLTIANVLAAFDIRPLIDPATGREKFPAIEFTTGGTTSQPKPFKCLITPRSPKHVSTINQN